MSANCRFAMAVHVMAVMAYKQGGCVSSAVLASSVNTNPVIIRRLLLRLQEAGLVATLKGPGLGSRLSRAAERINLGEVYRAVELDEPFGFPPNRPSHACPIGQGIRAALERVCRQMALVVQRDLETITLASLVEGITPQRDSNASPRSLLPGAKGFRKKR